MPNPDEVLQIVRQWAERAEEDLRAAEHLLAWQESCPTSTVCFHAQQCVEKYFKAFLTLVQIEFPKMHSIVELMMLLPAAARPQLGAEEQQRLTNYATITRYPGDWEPITRDEAEQAVGMARRVREAVRKHLPAAARNG
jgi:HEPN domain-containing protein